MKSIKIHDESRENFSTCKLNAVNNNKSREKLLVHGWKTFFIGDSSQILYFYCYFQHCAYN